MFTGIVEEMGEIVAIQHGQAAQITIRGPRVVADSKHGDSIAVNGVCLSIINHDPNTFSADVMAETLAASTLTELVVGDTVNLERAARFGDRIGGHIVQGHVDGIATIIERRDEAGGRVLRLAVPRELEPLIVRKGSIALDGVSLTVSATGEHWFEVSLIPETLSATTLGVRVIGDLLNVETDILARHLERLLEAGAQSTTLSSRERSAS